MNDLCATTLAQIVRGVLRMSSLPPLGGAWEPVYAVRLDASLIQPGDVLLTGPGLDERVVGRRQFAEEAFARQAVGVITAYRQTEPWAGTFVVNVSDAHLALHELAQWQRRQYRGNVVAFVGNTRATRLADYLEMLLTREQTVQRLAWQTPLDALAVSERLLELDTSGDVALCTLPAEHSDVAVRASRACRPDLVVNCLKQNRYVDAASIRELRRSMLPGSRLLSLLPLPPLPGQERDPCQMVTVGSAESDNICFQLERTSGRTVQLRYGDVAFGAVLPDTSTEENMLLLATCLELGMTASQLKRAWRLLGTSDSRRAA